MKCSVSNCVEERTLYNINFAKQEIAKGPEWRCVYHLPPEITFVVGLRSEEDLKKAGRGK